ETGLEERKAKDSKLLADAEGKPKAAAEEPARPGEAGAGLPPAGATGASKPQYGGYPGPAKEAADKSNADEKRAGGKFRDGSTRELARELGQQTKQTEDLKELN